MCWQKRFVCLYDSWFLKHLTCPSKYCRLFENVAEGMHPIFSNKSCRCSSLSCSASSVLLILLLISAPYLSALGSYLSASPTLICLNLVVICLAQLGDLYLMAHSSNILSLSSLLENVISKCLILVTHG